MSESALEKRFWDKVDVKGPDDCWLWTAGMFSSGYGQIRVGGKSRLAHRVSYEIHSGPIPDGMQVNHTCSGRYPKGSGENRRCVNPSHLKLGTAKSNSKDRRDDGKTSTGESHGRARLTEEQVLEIRAMHDSGEVTNQEIADAYGVEKSRISKIALRKSWGHV